MTYFFAILAGGGANSIGYLAPQLNSIQTSTDKYIKLYIHVVRKADGTGGATEAQVEAAIAQLNTDFNPLDIYFKALCEVIDIPRSDYTNRDLSCELFGNTDYQYDDGISLFFGEITEVNMGFVVAKDIPSTALWMSGRVSPSSLVPAINSVLISHEMGHCLGLFHTFRGTYDEGNESNCGGTVAPSCCELVDRTNGYDCGDYVPDTNADPRRWLSLANCSDYYFTEISPSGCVTGNAFENCDANPTDLLEICLKDSNGDPYVPPVYNIMSYTRLDCAVDFTTGQRERMHQMIETVVQLQDVLVQAKVINQSTTWTPSNTFNNGDFEITEDLIIEDGATLTINPGVTVRFGEAGRLIIKPNAQLILKGKLTSKECENYWQGIEVWGGNGSQYAVGGTRNQGRLKTTPGAIIEKADTAVKLYGPTVNDAGGQIISSGTTFANNRIAVDFAPYLNFWPYSFPSGQQGQPRNYIGRFGDCTFVTDIDYPLPTKFEVFAELNNVNGVLFSGCDFTNTNVPSAATTVGDYGYGIRASDAGFTVQASCTNPTFPCISYDRGTFVGLGYGVQSTGTDPENPRPFMVRQQDFDECYFGIYNSGVSNATILHNNFTMGDLPDAVLSSDQFGVFLVMGIAGFTLQENTFTDLVSDNTINTIGTYSRDLGHFSNEIRKNSYTGLDYGNLAEGDNALPPVSEEVRGLTYLCNTNTNVSDDFAVGNVFTANRIRPSQGLAEDVGGQVNYRAAGNRFSYVDTDFANAGEAITYYYYDGNTNEQPLTTTGSIVSALTSENTCPSDYCVPPCKTDTEIGLEKDRYYQERSDRDKARIFYQQTWAGATAAGRRTIAYHQQQMDKAAYTVVIHMLYDTIHFDKDSLALWVDNLEAFPAGVGQALQAHHNGDHETAAAVLERLGRRANLNSREQQDRKNLPLLFAALSERAQEPLSPLRVAALEAITKDPHSYTGNIAKNILRQQGHYFAPVYHLPGTKKINEPLTNVKGRSTGTLQVYPNPSNGQFTLHWIPEQPLVEQATLEIRTLAGQLITRRTVTALELTEVNLQGAKAGIYYYQLRVADQAPLSGKIIIQ
ncbi:MAG: zinc-dependent metalloprotease [Lewinella sp.]|uniref:zinc-dependent metalloprotease n=1 Tax=Lewinella sp. TaxID=2004506 RepID=UPI003D6A0A73